MKIAYLTHSLNPKTGVGAFSGTLIDRLRERMSAFTPVIITGDDDLAPGILGLVRRFPRLRRELLGCDIVHALDGFPYGVVGALLLLRSRVPLVITAIGTGALKKLSHPLYGLLLRYAYRRAVCVTAPSRFVARELERRVPGISVQVIHHGVDVQYWGAGREGTNRVNPPYIISVGAIKERKGHLDVVEAFAALPKKFSTYSLVIVGNLAQSAEYARRLTSRIRELNIEDRVVFESGLSRDELRARYRGAELFILLPKPEGDDVEGFGLVYLEAAAAGLPVVGTRSMGVEDAVSDGKNGYLVASGDTKAACATMVRILENPDSRRKLVAKSLEFAATLDWGRQTDYYRSIYEKFQG